MAIKQRGIMEHLLRGMKHSKQIAKPVLTSFTTRIDKKNPLQLFAAGKLHYKHRFFWSDSTQAMQIVGLGDTSILRAKDGNSRFTTIENEWKRLISGAIVNEGSPAFGTGPILFGGFSFDPHKPKSGKWKAFDEATFLLPTFMFTLAHGEMFVTINHICHADDDVEVVSSFYDQEVERLVDSSYDLARLQEQENLQFEEVLVEPWLESIREATKLINRGEIDKVVLARELLVRKETNYSIEEIISRLYKEQSTAYVFALQLGDACFLGATPERLVKMEESTCLSTCLAGSIGRGKSVKEDELLAHLLLQDAKNLHEHQLVVQMISEAMEEACDLVTKPDGPDIYKTPHIQHLYTPIIGKVKKNHSLLSMVDRLHPTPALGGFPKDRSLQTIREIEKLDRGWYAAPIGWMSHKGDGEFVVAIRSGLIEENEATLYAGCGIVADSDPESEYMETKMKFRPMMSALGGIQNGTF